MNAVVLDEGTNAQPEAGPSPDALLDVRGLKTEIGVRDGVVHAVDGVTFLVKPGQSVGLVGESGSGKTMSCLSIMRLMPVPSARIVAGEVWFEGVDLLALPEAKMRTYRGNRMAMVMQDPRTALNPVLTVGDQVAEPLRRHLGLSKREAAERVIRVLEAVRIPDAAKRMNDYPHQFSGGMRQRIAAAMGLVMEPKLIIADEPTTALDVTIQAQFLKLIRGIQERSGMAMLWVTHDLGVVAQTCDWVNVMYAGHIVESGPVRQILKEPRHPYTVGLMQSAPVLGHRRERLVQIAGQPPSLLQPPSGCPFYARCPIRMDVCRDEAPPATPSGDGFVRCWAAT